MDLSNITVEKELQIVFMGTPDFAEKSLEALQEIAKGDANKVFIPFEATNALSSLGALKEVVKDK